MSAFSFAIENLVAISFMLPITEILYLVWKLKCTHNKKIIQNVQVLSGRVGKASIRVNDNVLRTLIEAEPSES